MEPPFFVRVKRPRSSFRGYLTLKSNDLVKILEKQNEYCWVGELNGRSGYLQPSCVEIVSDGFARVTCSNQAAMQLEAGSVVHICEPYHRDWWTVEYGNQKGNVPSNTLEIINSKNVNARALYDFSSNNREELNFKAETIIRYKEPYDVNWFKGTIGFLAGLVPYNYVQFFVENTALQPPLQGGGHQTLSDIAPTPQLKQTTLKNAKVIYAYAAEDPIELTLEVGQNVEVIADLDNGWFKGRIGTSVGIFPCTFVELSDNAEDSAKLSYAGAPPKKSSEGDISKQLVCAICLEYAEEAVETSCCHNVFCKACLEMLPKNCCPQCRKPFTIEIAHLARRIIGEMEIQCTNKGCSVKSTRSELKYHLKNCKFRVYECTQCNFKDLKVSFAKHLVVKHLDGLMQSCKHFCKEP